MFIFLFCCVAHLPIHLYLLSLIRLHNLYGRDHILIVFTQCPAQEDSYLSVLARREAWRYTEASNRSS